MIQTIEMYQNWRKCYSFEGANSIETITNILQSLSQDRITLAFVAEFSRGKTELINALFFAETGVRLLPSSPGRTTMCPAELFFDKEGGNYIRLLEIETRLEEIPFFELKKDIQRWKQIDLDRTNPKQMQSAFQELVAVKRVSREKAIELGLFDEKEAAEQGIINPETVEIPCWRHALISFPHPLLQAGLGILDTPGLNALGSEPELTLSMLPSVQAVVFVIAADTGVTKSDLSMWNLHVCRVTNSNKNGLAVAMNKIDSMWDELSDESSYEQSIRTQVEASAMTLGISENFIFPVSAKQALIAKIKADDELLSRSKINALEKYLSEDIINHRQNILMDVVLRNVGFLIKESFTLTEINFENDSKQLHEFKKLNFENQDLINEMTQTAQHQQNAYFSNMELFKATSNEFRKKFTSLIESLSPSRFDKIIKINRIEISSSITTYAMKQGIKRLFDDLQSLLQECVSISNDMQKFIVRIHTEFDTEYGFKEIKPQLFVISIYQAELEGIFNLGEQFRISTNTALTEKSIVVQKLYNTLIFQARNTLFKARRDAMVWGNNVLSPIKNQILDHKKQIENRLVILLSAGESENKLNENIARLEGELEYLSKQRNELGEVIATMQRVNGITACQLGL
ncbi:dynamin family protein [Methyloglobulus sp.]|uniref:dynamin family protein n=1 Tax=Methyloglobulus sp. TaxID=2518622 RepID=UPI0032B7B13A